LDITDLVAPNRVIVGFRANSKSHLLAELARRAATATGLPQKQIGDALEVREALGSTGVGAGIAIPHAQIAELDRFYGLFIRLDRPIDYDAIDGLPVDLVFLLLIPANTKEHLHALAGISRRLRDAGIATALRRANGDQGAYEALTNGP
jgi:PTS system nitrogen regulatory IIA component